MVGHWLLERALVPQRIVSSTALRARSTAEVVAKSSGFSGKLELNEELYLASAGELLNHAREASDDYHSLMLVAHNPGMEDLVRILSGRPEPFPTGALAVFGADVDSWAALEPSADARLEHLFRPREME